MTDLEEWSSYLKISLKTIHKSLYCYIMVIDSKSTYP